MKASKLNAEDYIAGILSGQRSVLARAVTLIESQNPRHQELARAVLQGILPHSGKSWRIGLTGLPGAGKSSLIEALGCDLIEQGHRVAVLAIDPSSSLSHGSILGDKTRMEKLSQLEASFIRPSPSSGTLGGVARKTRETILLCEAAGYDVILVETVGVGQSEITVRQMVDFYLLVLLAGAGDDLQGIKRGVLEMADGIVFNKADGENLRRVEANRRELEMTLKYLSPFTPGWKVPVLTSSALENQGVQHIWQTIQSFAEQTQNQAIWHEQRQKQHVHWFETSAQEAILNSFFQQVGKQELFEQLKSQVEQGQLLVSEAIDQLL